MKIKLYLLNFTRTIRDLDNMWKHKVCSIFILKYV